MAEWLCSGLQSRGRRFDSGLSLQTCNFLAVPAVPGALAQIVDLAARATSEQIRLQVANDIMDRAGLKPTERIENITVEKSTEELRKELAQLTGSVTEADEEEVPVTLN